MTVLSIQVCDRCGERLEAPKPPYTWKESVLVCFQPNGVPNYSPLFIQKTFGLLCGPCVEHVAGGISALIVSEEPASE